jgi:capsular polysaccharide biosynthesis protein
MEVANKVVVSIINPGLNNSYDAIKARGGDGNIEELMKSGDRLVIYFSRSLRQERRVVNVEEIFKILSTSLLPGYRLVVMQSVPHPQPEMEHMYALWQQYARLVSRAKVIMGPHGKIVFTSIQETYVFC